MPATVKTLQDEVSGLAKDSEAIKTSVTKYNTKITQLLTKTDTLDKEYEAELKKIEADAKKAEQDAKTAYVAKLRAVAKENTQELAQVQADAKLVRMSAERLSKIITEGKTATGDDAAKKALNTAAENARKAYSGLSTQIATLEAGVRKVEQACKG